MLSDDYTCDGFRHVYRGFDYVYGNDLCPEYPDCRSDAATRRALEEENMNDYTYDGRYAGIFTTGKQLLDGPDPEVDILTEAKQLLDPEASTTPSVHTFAVLAAVFEERQKQEIKWGQQNHNDLMWNAILSEEVGESAQEVLTQEWGEDAGGGHGNLREELVQVAAVAVAWIEAIDRRTVDV